MRYLSLCLGIFITLAGIASAASYKTEFYPAASGSSINNVGDLNDIDTGKRDANTKFLKWDGSNYVADNATIDDIPELSEGTFIAGDFPMWNGTYYQPTQDVIRRDQYTYETIYVDGGALIPSTTAGATAATWEANSSGPIDFDVMEFASTANQTAQFSYAFPAQWNASNYFYARFFWDSKTATTGERVQWCISAVSFGDGEAHNATTPYSDRVCVSDTMQTAGYMHVTSATSGFLAGGSPSTNNLVHFKVERYIDEPANDNATATMELFGVRVQYARQEDSISEGL